MYIHMHIAMYMYMYAITICKKRGQEFERGWGTVYGMVWREKIWLNYSLKNKLTTIMRSHWVHLVSSNSLFLFLTRSHVYQAGLEFATQWRLNFSAFCLHLLIAEIISMTCLFCLEIQRCQLFFFQKKNIEQLSMWEYVNNVKILSKIGRKKLWLHLKIDAEHSVKSSIPLRVTRT